MPATPQCRWIKSETCREGSSETSSVYTGQATTTFSRTPTMLTQVTQTPPWRNITDSWMPSAILGAAAFPDGWVGELRLAAGPPAVLHRNARRSHVQVVFRLRGSQPSGCLPLDVPAGSNFVWALLTIPFSKGRCPSSHDVA